MIYSGAEKADTSLLERVNPVFLTARMALGGLAMSGDSDAAAICEKLGLESPRMPDPAEAAFDEERLAAMRDIANSVFLEIRYRTIGAMAEKSGCETIVDLPCGYTPRSIQMSRKNRRYIGLDLPATISEAERIILPMIKDENRSFIRYAAVDATNHESLEAALEGADGPFCITTEGLLMYFNNHETSALCDNVRRLLKKYGGCWITSDPEMMIQNAVVMKAIAGDRYREIVAGIVKGFESKADIHVETPEMMILPWKNDGKDIAADTQRAMDFLSEKGLKAERLTVGEYMPEINSFSALHPETAEAIKKGMEQCVYWKITLKDVTETVKEEVIETEAFKAQAVVAGDTLELSLGGRVDTITAPEVLELYEKISKENPVSAVVIDCTKLQYISSAGLRVLLIMQKNHDVKLKAVSSEVKEILETTGFDSMIDIEEAP